MTTSHIFRDIKSRKDNFESAKQMTKRSAIQRQ